MDKLFLEDCCEILDSMRVPITAKDRKAGPYPYYGANGVQDHVADYIFDDELVLLAEDGGNFGPKRYAIVVISPKLYRQGASSYEIGLGCTQKGRFFLCTFSWRFVYYSLSLHHHLKSYAKKSERKEWNGHLPRYAQGYQSSGYL